MPSALGWIWKNSDYKYLIIQKSLTVWQTTLQLKLQSSLEWFLYFFPTCLASFRTVYCSWSTYLKHTAIVQATWLGLAKLFWHLNVVNKLHGVVSMCEIGSGRTCPVCVLGASLRFSSVSDPWGLKFSLRHKSLAAGWSQTINNFSSALMHFWYFSLEKRTSLTWFPESFRVFLLQACKLKSVMWGR